MKQTDQKIMCPDCGTEIKGENVLSVGDILECQECGTEVEVLSLSPLKYQTLVEEI